MFSTSRRRGSARTRLNSSLPYRKSRAHSMDESDAFSKSTGHKTIHGTPTRPLDQSIKGAPPLPPRMPMKHLTPTKRPAPRDDATLQPTLSPKRPALLTPRQSTRRKSLLNLSHSIKGSLRVRKRSVDLKQDTRIRHDILSSSMHTKFDKPFNSNTGGYFDAVMNSSVCLSRSSSHIDNDHRWNNLNKDSTLRIQPMNTANLYVGGSKPGTACSHVSTSKETPIVQMRKPPHANQHSFTRHLNDLNSRVSQSHDTKQPHNTNISQPCANVNHQSGGNETLPVLGPRPQPEGRSPSPPPGVTNIASQVSTCIEEMQSGNQQHLYKRRNSRRKTKTSSSSSFSRDGHNRRISTYSAGAAAESESYSSSTSDVFEETPTISSGSRWGSHSFLDMFSRTLRSAMSRKQPAGSSNPDLAYRNVHSSHPNLSERLNTTCAPYVAPKVPRGQGSNLDGRVYGRRYLRQHGMNQTFTHGLSLAVGEDPAAASNVKLVTACSVNNISSKPNNGGSHAHQNKAGRVAAWAVNFQNLLSDSVGIDIFTEFLQKEFSEENIIFWKACEQYRQLKDDQQLRMQANDIYNRYLSNKADDPVNVDSTARAHTEQHLDKPTALMFDLAQQQIFQLMRQDSYSRFLKSDLYKCRVMDEMAGIPLKPATNSKVDSDAPAKTDLQGQDKKKGKGKENEDKRRRSILPWRNVRKSIKEASESKKNSKKSKDEKDVKEKKDVQQSQPEQQVAPSVVSPASTSDNNLSGHSNGSDIGGLTGGAVLHSVGTVVNMKKAPGPGIDLSTMRKEVFQPKDSREPPDSQFKFCRIVMPDGSTTVVCAKPGQSTRYVLGKLCEKRSISLASVDVFLLGSDRLLDLNEDISNLGSKEIVIEQRVMFRLDMPSGKSIGVKSKPNRSVRDVFRPILHKYGYNVDNVAVRMVASQEFLDLDVAVSELDKQRAVVLPTNTDVADWVRRGGMPALDPATPDEPPSVPSSSSLYQGGQAWRGGSLEEVTNKIFEDLMRGKSQLAHGFDELGVLELDKAKATKNDEGRSLGLFGLLRKESWGTRDNPTKSKTKGKVTFALPRTESKKKGSNSKEGERLFELLSSAQSLRLEEQRGTHISPGELPSFLCEDSTEKPEDCNHPETFHQHHDEEEMFDDVIEISKASSLDNQRANAWKRDTLDKSQTPRPFALTPCPSASISTPRLSTSTPRGGAKYGSRTLAITPLPANPDQGFKEGNGVSSINRHMSPVVVDSQSKHGQSVEAALELRSSDKYPDILEPSRDEPYSPLAGSSFSRLNGMYALPPRHTPPEGRKERAPVASPEKFSPKKKKQKNNENRLSTFDTATTRDDVATPASDQHQYFTGAIYNPSPKAALSSSSSSNTRTSSPYKSPSPQTIVASSKHSFPVQSEEQISNHVGSIKRATPTNNLGKNRLSDGMLLHKLKQAQKERNKGSSYEAWAVSGLTYSSRSTPSPTFIPQEHLNLSKHALLSPRLSSTRSSWQTASSPPIATNRLRDHTSSSLRFDSIDTQYYSDRDKRDPPPYRKRMSPTQIGAVLSPRYSAELTHREGLSVASPGLENSMSTTALLSPRYSFKSSFISSSNSLSEHSKSTLPSPNFVRSPLKENSNGSLSSGNYSLTPQASQPHLLTSPQKHLSSQEETVTFV